MTKVIKIRATLFDKNPNDCKYKGRRGMVVSVNMNGKITDRYEWSMRYFSPNGRINGALESIKMEALIHEGWQVVNETTLGHWTLVESDGVRIGTEEGFVKLF
jgi:hypothetical protein